jgi:hypothetical protein
MQQWEYKTLYDNGFSASDKMNKLGAEGWELVSATPMGAGSVVCALRRPLEQERLTPVPLPDPGCGTLKV